MGGFCIGIIGFNRGECRRVVCSGCHKAKINCPLCQIKAEAESWTTKGGVKKSEKRPLKFCVKGVATRTPQTGETTGEKLTNSSTLSRRRSSGQSPNNVSTDRLLIGTISLLI
jgi:hypothetical protein